IGPLAGLQGTLDIDLCPLAQIFLGDRDEVVVEDDDAVPLGAFLAFARDPVAPALAGRDVQVGDARAVLSRADLRVAAEITDENHLVDPASHRVTACFGGVGGAFYQVPAMFLHNLAPAAPPPRPATAGLFRGDARRGGGFEKAAPACPLIFVD